MPSPPPSRPGLGPPPSLEGLSALLSKNQGGLTNGEQSKSPTTRTPFSNGTSSGTMQKSQSLQPAPTLASPTISSLLSPSHPTNLRKQAITELDPNFSIKSYLGAANALLEKARSSEAQGQAEQAYVNYLKCAR